MHLVIIPSLGIKIGVVFKAHKNVVVLSMLVKVYCDVDCQKKITNSDIQNTNDTIRTKTIFECLVIFTQNYGILTINTTLRPN